MPSMAQAVSRHNMHALHEDQQQVQQPGCNCQNGVDTCPVEGKCLTDCVVYKATVTETGSGNAETYTGATCQTFKKRWDSHRFDVRHIEKRNSSRLSGHIWDIKDQNLNYEIDWKLIDRAASYNPITRKCRVCLKEKYYIMYHRDDSSLNKRHEIFNTCRHRTQKLLKNLKT